MSSLTIATSQGSYQVIIGSEVLSDELIRHSAAVVDPVLQASVQGLTAVISFEASESEKTLQGVERLLVDMNALGMKRGSTLAAVGGGVIQDVVTLASSIYMRGIPWVYAPTTMMAMLDSCIGGKSSINVTGIKNLVGNIYPPSRVIVDVTLAQSLPVEARVAGYSEAVKICFAGGPAALDRFMELAIPAEMYGNESSSRETVELTHHVLNVKKWFIEIDELDRRERLLLNFGHTFGHALESALDFSVPHGVAIAIGMNAALKFSDHRSEQAHLLQSYITSLGAQLPTTFRSRLEAPDWERFSRALASDKKGTPTHLRFVLESRTGVLELVERERSQATFDKARESMSQALDEFAQVCGGGL